MVTTRAKVDRQVASLARLASFPLGIKASASLAVQLASEVDLVSVGLFRATLVKLGGIKLR
jgi:hypothetical protein